MNKIEAMKQLKAMGTAQNRKVYGRHLGDVEMFGVSYANLGKLQREIKVDQRLAEQLWATGNLDACVLATMIADPQQMTARMLDSWVKECPATAGLASALSNLAAESPVARKRVEKWTKSNNEWIGVRRLAHPGLARPRRRGLVRRRFSRATSRRSRTSIHSAKNYTRYAMNNALISIGIRNPKLRKLAVAAAKRIGKVEVDHGDTSCKTPDAVPYIAKAVAHNAKKAAKKKAKKRAASTR